MELKRLNFVNEKDAYKSILSTKFQEMNDFACSLKKLTELHRKLRTDRGWLIAQWESIITVVTVRDEEIKQLSKVRVPSSLRIRKFYCNIR